MSKDEKETAEAPKKSKKLLMIIVIAVVVLAGGGAGAFFMLSGDSAEAKAEPVKGVVTVVESPLTINLADGHYLKVGFALQQTKDAAEAVDPSKALDLAIDHYTGREVAELSNTKGREKLKAELLDKIEKAYEEEGKQTVMDIYFTSFVTQ